jgi:anti-sigma B factor antagonist
VGSGQGRRKESGLDVPERERSADNGSVGQVGLRVDVDRDGEQLDPPRKGPTVRLGGDLDMEGAPALEETLIGLIDGGAAHVVVDLTGLEFIDSTGLQCLLRATEHARENGHTLRFRRGTGQVEGVMRLTRVGEMLPFVD